MIVVNCALKQKEIISTVENIVIEDKKTFKYVNKKGIKLYFESNFDDTEKACLIIKKAIKESEFGSALLFNVCVE